MRKYGKIKRIIAYLLSICLLVSGLSIADYSMVEAGVVTGGGTEDGGTTSGSTTVYFLNDSDVTNINAYGYDDMIAAWPGVAVEEATEIDSDLNWVKVNVPSEPPFGIIFLNADNTEEKLIETQVEAGKVYLTAKYGSFASAEEAEQAKKDAETVTGSTTVYFYNNHNWANVSAYAFYGDSETQLFGGWPGEAAEAAEELGEGWWKKEVPKDAQATPFTIIFNNNNAGKQTANISITDNVNVYTNANGEAAYASQEEAVENATEAPEDFTTIQNGELTLYFYNYDNWANVYAYSYNGNSYVEGGEEWPGALAQEATDLGAGWWKVTVKADSLFSIIFHDNAGNRVDGAVQSTKDIYFSSTGTVYQSTKELEISLGVGATNENSTTVYFKKNSDWGNIYGYVYGNDTSYGASWPGVAATDASEETGSNDWWKIIVPKVATEDDSFNVIFTDSMAQTNGIEIKDQTNVYVIPDSQVFDNVADADVEAAKYVPLFDREDPNEDIDNYAVTYNGAGANLPYTTYEAEAADTNATVLEKSIEYLTMQSEASGREAVKLEEEGDYVEFTLTEPANAFVLRYSMPDSADGTGVNASLSMYADGEETDLALTSKYAWVYGVYPYFNDPSQGEPHRFFDETRGLFGKTLPAGTKIKLQKNAEDTADYYVIDFIECEMVEEAGTQPENSLSITDYGAVADDGSDDAAAIKECIEAAKEAGKEVWIPAGTFNVTEKTPFVVSDVTIRGAGMWYSNLEGAGASFHYSRICKFYDFAMTGVSAIRDDGGDLAGFEGKGAALNVTIQNIWMEHMKVGVWSYNSKNLAIQGCRIRNTYADGINLSSRTVNAVVQNNSVRNTGDDGIACWPNSFNSTGNTIKHNTVQLPTLANGIIIYGGADNTVEANYVADIVVNGSGIGVGSEFTTSDGFTGTITVKDNELHRCGSYHKDRAYPVGAIWLWASNGPMTTQFDVMNNNLYDCSYEAFLLDCWSNLTGVTLKDNNVHSANTDGILIRGNEANTAVTGSATVDNVVVAALGGELVVNDIPDLFTLNQTGKGIYQGEITDAGEENPGEGETPDPTVAVTGVTLSETTLELKEGETAILTATVAPETATNKEVEWTSGNTTIVTVKDGVVTAVKAGTTDVYVTTKDGAKVAKCEVTVTEQTDDGKEEETPSVSDNTPGSGEGDESDGKEEETPSVSDNTPGTEEGDEDDGKEEETPSVSDNTPGSGEGDEDDGKEEEETPSVSDNTPGSGEGDEDDGKEEEETPSVSDNTPGTGEGDEDDGKEEGENPSVSDNTPETGEGDEDDGKEEEKPPVTNNGVTTGGNQTSGTGNEGTQTPGTENGNTQQPETEQPTQEVKVTKIKITGLSKKIAYNKKIQLIANVTPADAANKAVTWSVNNKKYASVSKSGVVKFKKAAQGKTVTVTATAKDGSGIEATYKIKVMKKAVSKIKLKADTSVKAGKSVKVKATVTPSKNVNKELTWTSSNTKYATVNKKGVVKTKKAGKGKTVKITAKATDGSGKKATIKIKIK